MFDIPRLYLSACSNSTQLVPLHPIIMSILFHHYKELTQLVSEVQQIEGAVVNSSENKKEVTIEEEEEARQKLQILYAIFVTNTSRKRRQGSAG